MSEDSGTARLELSVGDDADAEELERLTSSLRRELLDLDVEDVSRPTVGPPPPGARAVEIAALAALVVKLGQSAGALSSLVSAVQGWASRGTQRTVKLELDGDTLEVTGVSSETQDRLVAAWLERHAA